MLIDKIDKIKGDVTGDKLLMTFGTAIAIGI